MADGSEHGSWPSRVCIVGAGAIGALIGVRLAQSDNDCVVSFLARGAHLAAMKADGLRLVQSGDAPTLCVTESHRCAFVSALSDLPPQDLIFLAIKEHQIPAIADELNAIVNDSTVFVTLQNGIPWWYFQRYSQGPSELCDRAVHSVDPGGKLAAKIDSRRIIGCVVYPAGHIVEPGVVKHEEGVRFPVGELDGERTERIQRISALLVAAGFKSPVLDDIRAELWLKLWGSCAFNPISALCHATLKTLCTFKQSRELATEMMKEAERVANALGAKMRVPLERRLDGAAKVGHHKTSMLADVEAGRKTEIEALLGSVLELAELVSVSAPSLRAVYALMKLLEHVAHTEHGGASLVFQQ